MRDVIYLGIGMVAVSAFHLIPAILTGEIPARGAVAPLTAEDRPGLYPFVFATFAATGALGAILLAVTLCRDLAGAR